MKVVRIYHRKEVARELKRMISFLPRLDAAIYLVPFKNSHEAGRYFRQFRIKYGIYECF